MSTFLDMETCISLTQSAYPLILDALRHQNVTTTTTTPRGYCFDIILPTNHIVKAIQISICPFRNKDIAQQDNNSDQERRIIYETALVGFNDTFLYHKGLLYDDEDDEFKQFHSLQDVIDEVKRIIRTVV
jgi:hypothetical protein